MIKQQKEEREQRSNQRRRAPKIDHQQDNNEQTA